MHLNRCSQHVGSELGEFERQIDALVRKASWKAPTELGLCETNTTPDEGRTRAHTHAEGLSETKTLAKMYSMC